MQQPAGSRSYGQRAAVSAASLLLLLALAVLSLLAPAHGESTDMPQGGPNPYAGKSYGGCKGGFCESVDEALEQQFWAAAADGDTKAVKQLLANDRLNLTRNIVPDDDGLARVLDVAVWVASEKGRHDVMRALLSHPGVPKLYEYEDGHILDLAAANGDVTMVNLLLEFNMTVGPSAMAHAAHFNHTGVMEVLLSRPTDLKSALQAISNGGSEEMARLLLKALKDRKDAKKEAEQAHGAYDWYGDYVQLAVKSGNVAVLQALLDGGYELKWQQAQDLIKLAAVQGGPTITDILLSQPLFKTDKDELDEAVDTAIKAAAELGQPDIVDLLLAKFPEQAAAHCKAGLFRALKFGQDAVVARLSAVCPVDVSKSSKLQDAEWLGKVLNAARKGDAAAMKALLAAPEATARLKKLRKPVVEDDGSDKKKQVPQGPAIDPKHDPLVIAAVGGHLELVKQLEELGVLCAPCAAAEAARKNQTAVVQHIAQGSGKVMLQNFEDVIQNALRVVAYSMEAHNWELVAWLLQHHDSKDLGPYFFPVIAQEGKLGDMRRMISILQDLGLADRSYFKQQVHSAMISAGLGGHLELLLELKQHSDPLHGVQAGTSEGDDDDYDDSTDGDKTEL